MCFEASRRLAKRCVSRFVLLHDARERAETLRGVLYDQTVHLSPRLIESQTKGFGAIDIAKSTMVPKNRPLKYRSLAHLGCVFVAEGSRVGGVRLSKGFLERGRRLCEFLSQPSLQCVQSLLVLHLADRLAPGRQGKPPGR